MAHPDKSDKADYVPHKSGLKDLQSIAKLMFFIHPTTYTYEPTSQFAWNADVNDKELNDKTDNSTILESVSAFNGSGRIFAPVIGKHTIPHSLPKIRKTRRDHLM
jgi:hypothetical protein